MKYQHFNVVCNADQHFFKQESLNIGLKTAIPCQSKGEMNYIEIQISNQIVFS